MLSEKFFSIAGTVDQFVLYLLFVLSIVSIALILERYATLSKIYKQSLQMKELMGNILFEGKWDQLQGIATEGQTIEHKALQMGLSHAKKFGTKGLEEVFSGYLLLIKPQLEKHLGFLATIGSNAPYIGLFGTVLGIMKSFQDLSVTTDAGSQTVMAGISSALLATASGLFVAIPAVMAFNFFQKRVKAIVQSVNLVSEVVMAWGKSTSSDSQK